MTTKTLDNFTGAYGPDWVTGVLADHVGAAEAAGMLLHCSPKGWAHMTGPKGGAALPVLCGEIVWIYTEDGKIDGRCGLPVKFGEYACPGHWDSIY